MTLAINEAFNGHLLMLARQLVEGHADYLEAGDIRTPGLATALRASASGDAAKPLAIEPAVSLPPLAQMSKYTVEEGLALLTAHAVHLAHTPIGPAAMVFTVKLRKSP